MRKSPPDTTQNWLLVGWHGITLWVPDDWTFTPPKDPNETHVSVVSPNEHWLQVRSQQTSKKKVNLKKSLDNYLNAIENEHKKKKIKFSGKVTPLSEREMEFNWWAERKAYGLIRHCNECNKVTISELSVPKNKFVLQDAKNIVNSVNDHSDDDWTTWAAFGLAFEAPKEYKLEKAKYTSGYISMTFEYKGEKIDIQRWGLADLALKKFTLEEWAQNNSDWQRAKGTLTHVNLNHHDGILWSGRANLWMKILNINSALMRAKLTSFNQSGAAWHCPESNRIFVVNWQHRKPKPIDELISRVLCHW